jgi:G:T/U-mismatch repair DNA glycosylase
MPASVSNAVLQFTAAAAASNAATNAVNKSSNGTANSSAAYSQSRLLALLQRIPSKTVDTGTTAYTAKAIYKQLPYRKLRLVVVLVASVYL